MGVCLDWQVRVLEDNQVLRNKLASLPAAEPTEFLQLDIGQGVVMDAWMMKPPQFEPLKKYVSLVN